MTTKLTLFTTVANQIYVGRVVKETDTHVDVTETHIAIVTGQNGIMFAPFGAPLNPTRPDFIVSIRKSALLVDPEDAPPNLVRAFSQFQTGLVLPTK